MDLNGRQKISITSGSSLRGEVVKFAAEWLMSFSKMAQEPSSVRDVIYMHFSHCLCLLFNRVVKNFTEVAHQLKDDAASTGKLGATIFSINESKDNFADLLANLDLVVNQHRTYRFQFLTMHFQCERLVAMTRIRLTPLIDSRVL